MARLLAGVHRRRGANPVLLDDAMDAADQRPIAATRAVMRWSRALEGRGPMPERFRPDRLLVGEDARSEAQRLLERNLAAQDDPVQRRHLAMLLEFTSPGVPDRAEVDAVGAALEARLAAVAVANPAGGGAPGAAERVLAWLDELLRSGGHRPFLMSGTLLGAVREGRLLDHDYDLDLGLLPGDGTATSVGELLSGLDEVTVTIEEGRVWGRHRDGVAFDVFLHSDDGGRYWHTTGAHAWWNTPFELASVEVAGRSYLAPADAHRYLDENYGDWVRPVAFFDKNIDTPNLEWRRTTEALYYLHDLVLDATEERDRSKAEAALEALRATFGIDLTHHLPGSAADADS